MAFPSPALDYEEERITLDELLMPNPLSTYIMEAETDAMLQAGIFPTTKLIIDKSISAKNGDIVVVSVYGEYQVRYLRRNQLKGWLCPAHPKMRDVEIIPEMECQIFGVVTSYFTDPKLITHVFSR